MATKRGDAPEPPELNNHEHRCLGLFTPFARQRHLFWQVKGKANDGGGCPTMMSLLKTRVGGGRGTLFPWGGEAAYKLK